LNTALSSVPGVQVFEWSKAIETGHYDIDSQHQALFEFLRRLHQASLAPHDSAPIRQILVDLKDYVVMHFQFEENLMQSFYYDKKDMHMRAHAACIKKISDLEQNASKKTDTCNVLTEFIYEWLIAHIAKVDQDFVAKLEGGNQTNISGDICTAQTLAVIDGAFAAAGLVEKISALLGTTRGMTQRRKFAAALADASERLVNLISLAEDRVEAYGCSDSDLSRLRKIEGAVKTSVRSLIDCAVQDLIDYGSNIIAGKFGLPFGIGAAMTMRMTRIGTLLNVAGGFPALDEAVRKNVARAAEIANEVTAMEANALPMPDFAKAADRQGKSREVGSDAWDHHFVDLVQASSRRIAQLFEQAVDSGKINLEELFDETYIPIAGTNPQQYSTRFDGLAEALLPDIQEAILAENDTVIYAVAQDRRGYVPAHNRKHSFRQGKDPAWNAAHCRNKRIFDDRVNLAAARNTTELLLQTYLRNLGGDEIVVVKDAAAPITVKGRHWGAFRLGYPLAKT